MQPGIELGSPIPFSVTITFTLICLHVSLHLIYEQKTVVVY